MQDVCNQQDWFLSPPPRREAERAPEAWLEMGSLTRGLDVSIRCRTCK